MKEIIFTVFLYLLVHGTQVVVSIQPGGQCESQFGDGLCTPISQCKLLPRIKMLGLTPKMCGFDSNGPIVCCPKYSHNIQVSKSNNDWPKEPQFSRPDLPFDQGMQNDEPINNHRSSDYYHNSGDRQNYKKYNGQTNRWNNNEELGDFATTSSLLNNGRRKSTHNKFYDRPDISTKRYQNNNEDNFRPQHRPSFESNSYESNEFSFRPGVTRPSSFSPNSPESWSNNNNEQYPSNSPQLWNNNNENQPFTSNSHQSFNNYNNRPLTTTERYSHQSFNYHNNRPLTTTDRYFAERPSFNNPSNNRPFTDSNQRPGSFGISTNPGSSNFGFGETVTEDKPPVWGSVDKQKTTYRPTSARPDYSNQNGWSNSRPKRVSQIKCEEYSEIVTNNLRPLPLLPNPEVVPVSVKKCTFDALALIVGGTDTSAGEFPHMAAIGFQGRGNLNWNCGGTLISDQHILTAAHCTHSNEGQPVKVRLGDWNIKRDDEIETVDYRVAKIIVHPQYSKNKKYNDIALLQLDSKVRFIERIRPACLFDKDDIPVNKSIATGWGRLETAGAKSGILQKVDMPLVSNRDCNEMYQDMGTEASLNRGITSNMVCAGDLKGGYDTCLGDSGGPLQFRSPENGCVYYIVGITSFGKTMCGQPRSPGVYTRISSFLPWIESIVWPESS